MDIAEKQWNVIKTFLPLAKSGSEKPGRPPTCFRKVLNGILWAHRTGVPYESNRRYGHCKDGRCLRRCCNRWKVERLFFMGV